jgi:hypothetical protein
MNQPETSVEHPLEQRLLALEARVVALETVAADLPEKSKRVKSYARDVSASNLNSRLELLSLIEDHVEVLKLIHGMVKPVDSAKNKLVLNYIRRAESKLEHFQSRFAQLEETHKRLENGSGYTVPPEKPGVLALFKASALNRLLRSAARWNM